MQTIAIDDSTHVLVLTGAGVSAESGIPTFRDANGLWEQHRVEDVASPEGFKRDPVLVWRFYSQRRAAARDCVPNAGHHALAALEERLGDRFLLATQNIDGLHAKAGSTRLIEMHGNLYTSRCIGCDRAPFRDEQAYADKVVPMCGECGAPLRPHIVWFGEMLDVDVEQRLKHFMHEATAGRDRFVFIAVGTSGLVYPAAGMVRNAKYLGAECWLVNAEPAANVGDFDHFVQGKSAEVLPALLGVARQ
jgi:NAD-dependent deacetylase